MHSIRTGAQYIRRDLTTHQFVPAATTRDRIPLLHTCAEHSAKWGVHVGAPRALVQMRTPSFSWPPLAWRPQAVSRTGSLSRSPSDHELARSRPSTHVYVSAHASRAPRGLWRSHEQCSRHTKATLGAMRGYVDMMRISRHSLRPICSRPPPNHRQLGLTWPNIHALAHYEANLRASVALVIDFRAALLKLLQTDAACASGRTADALWRLKSGDELVHHSPIISGEGAELWPVGAQAHVRPRGSQEPSAAHAEYSDSAHLAHLGRHSGDDEWSSCAAIPSHWSRTA